MDELNKKYYYGKHSIDEEDVKSVIDVLKSNWITQGPKIKEFENTICEKFGSKNCTVVNSGTAALHLSALALDWGKNDIVITSPMTFLASVNCILYAGAKPDFSDIDEKSYTIDIQKLEDKIKSIYSSGKKIKAVIGVDYAGHPCDWYSLRYLADKYGFQLVNDNCHALGAEFKGDIQYAVKYADAVCHSYHPVKHITTGEGGAVLTNNYEIDRKIKLLRTHGITKSDSEFKIQNSELTGPWYYEMQMLGFNYRITDFQCALGISQMKKLNEFVEKRRKIALYYDNAFGKDERFIVPVQSSDIRHSYHIYPLQIKFENLDITKIEYFKKLAVQNIFCQVHYIPVHLQPYYMENFGFKKGDFPAAEKFYEREISIPIYPSLRDEDIDYITNTIKSVLN
jgi:UDP-4-amino-4,6-dideoxy-N-acetyl-beta-L-altrosamine transaminase